MNTLDILINFGKNNFIFALGSAFHGMKFAYLCRLIQNRIDHGILFETDIDRFGLVVWRPVGCHHRLCHRWAFLKQPPEGDPLRSERDLRQHRGKA